MAAPQTQLMTNMPRRGGQVEKRGPGGAGEANVAEGVHGEAEFRTMTNSDDGAENGGNRAARRAFANES